jgi:hypothetical protein
VRVFKEVLGATVILKFSQNETELLTTGNNQPWISFNHTSYHLNLRPSTPVQRLICERDSGPMYCTTRSKHKEITKLSNMSITFQQMYDEKET